MTNEEVRKLKGDELMQFLKDAEENELWQKSVSFWKGMQMRRFFSGDEPMTKRIFHLMDSDKSTKIGMFINIEDGVITDRGDMAAVETMDGHFEFWTDGLIMKVVSKGGRHVEIWEGGVPIKIDDGSEVD